MERRSLAQSSTPPAPSSPLASDALPRLTPNARHRIMIPMRMLQLLLTCTTLFAQTPPKEWVDPDTGHRVIRLTDEPGSASLYFNQNGFTPDGKKLVYTTPY